MNHDYMFSRNDFVKTNIFLKKVYQYMTLGVLITAFVSFAMAYTTSGQNVLNSLFSNPALLWILFGIEFLFVLFFSRRVFSLPGGVGLAAFLIYSALNGITLGSIFFVYTTAVIFKAFTTTILLFAFLGFVGNTTEKDFSSAGRIAIAGVFALIIGSVINMFLNSTPLELGLSVVGVIVFSVLVMYDSQKLKQIAQQPNAENYAVLGAFSLYLDFINLFLYLLRIFGIGSSRD